MKPPKLDPRKSRKLTSRECCSVLGGYLGGMLTTDLVGLEAARDALKLFAERDDVWAPYRHQAARGAKVTAEEIERSRSLKAEEADPGLRVFWRGLGSVIAGLRAVSHEKAVRTAVRWLYETDTFWPKEAARGYRPSFLDVDQVMGGGSVNG